jgi:restriction system protein
MFGSAPFGALPFGAISGPRPVLPTGPDIPTLLVQGLILPETKTSEGMLIKSTTAIWLEIARLLGSDWSLASQLDPTQWEEMVAGAYERSGYKVILTPRSGDFGRDIIASTSGIGSVRILGSVKAYKPGHLVTADDVRVLAGVLSTDLKASKGIITTTSDFAPRIASDPSIAPLVPTRLQMVKGLELQGWLSDLAQTAPSN